MPDLMTHILIGLIICDIAGIKRKSLVLIGSILPDLLLKGIILSPLLNLPFMDLKWLLVPLHNPAGLIFVTCIICLIFTKDHLRIYGLIALGWASHLAADLTNKEIYMNQLMLLYPFSWKAFEMNIFWSNQFYYTIIIAALIYAAIRIVKHIRAKQQ